MSNQRQGPATFAIEADPAVAQASLPQIGSVSAQPGQISPGMTAQAPGIDGVNAKTFKAITDLASGILAPKIKAAAQEQFIGGVQRAMTGEALGEIIKDQPWYTDVFAPSSALAGARAYTSEAAVAAWAGKMQEQMPHLSKQGPEELRGAATAALQGFMTGDPAADALITGSVVQQMAPLFKQHAKEHYIHVQKQASMAQINAWEGAAGVYQHYAAAEASGQGTVSPEDKEAAKSRLLGSLAPFADQSEESYERNVTGFLEGAATAGNFQVIKLFKDSGLYAKLNPDKRATLDRQLAAAGRTALDKQMPKFGLDVAMLVRDMEQNPKDIPAKVKALNDRAAKMTGVTEAELIPVSQLDNIIGNVLTSQAAEARAAANRKAPAEDNGHIIAGGLMDQRPGSVDAALDVGLVKKTEVERAGMERWSAAKDPVAKAAVVNSMTTAGFGTIKAELQGTLRSEEFHAGIGQMAQVYKGMAENVKTHYFNEKQMTQMDRFQSLVNAGMPAEAAWVSAKTSPGVNEFSIADDPKGDVAKAIRAHAEKSNENFVGWNRVDDAALRTIEALTMRSYKSARSNNPTDVAVARSYQMALTNGLDIQGSHAIINARPTDRPLFAVVGEGREATGTAFADLMAEKAKSLGATLDNYEAIRVPDRGGRATIWVNAVDDKGRTVSWAIDSGEIKARVVKGVKLPTVSKPAGGGNVEANMALQVSP
jgi:hypothetical protein